MLVLFSVSCKEIILELLLYELTGDTRKTNRVQILPSPWMSWKLRIQLMLALKVNFHWNFYISVLRKKFSSIYMIASAELCLFFFIWNENRWRWVGSWHIFWCAILHKIFTFLNLTGYILDWCYFMKIGMMMESKTSSKRSMSYI